MKNYWTDFWNKNQIINKPTLHEMVGRTINGVAIGHDLWETVLSDLEKQLGLNDRDTLLDIGAGSGALSIPFSKKVKSVTALDVSQKLLNEIKGDTIHTLLADAREVDFPEGSFSKIVIYFAIQHFSEKETIELMTKMHKWLKKDGMIFIGDIPDIDKQFVFFNDPKRRKAYFDSVVNETPIIGTWFHKDFFANLGPYLNYSSTTVISQPAAYINAHYRFDALFIK